MNSRLREQLAHPLIARPINGFGPVLERGGFIRPMFYQPLHNSMFSALDGNEEQRVAFSRGPTPVFHRYSG